RTLLVVTHVLRPPRGKHASTDSQGLYTYILRSRHPPLFLFYRHDHHRDLHSFPTRRSSDLFLGRRRRLNPRSGLTTAWAKRTRRSEEHTSELQSLRHLVCRLLLEKKTTIAERQAAKAHAAKARRGRTAARTDSSPATDRRVE